MMRTSLTGLQAASKTLNVVSNNLANGATTAFKRSVAQFEDMRIGDTASRPQTQVGQGALTIEVQRQTQQGALESSNSSLDIAISGGGYFVLGSGNANGDATYSYSRAGKLSIAKNGDLVNAEGMPVTGYQTLLGNVTSTVPMPLNFNAAAGGNLGNVKSVNIDSSGRVSIARNDGSVAAVGTLALAHFSNEGALKQQSGTILKETDRSGPAMFGAPGKNGLGVINQGNLEATNVDITQELLSMINAQQAYNGNSRALQTESEMMRSITETLIR